jgi:hypothetical protein
MVKKSILILSLLLTACKTEIISTVCPPAIIYTEDFNDNLKKDLIENKSFFINQVIIDFFNLQQDLKICNGIE